MKLKDNNGKEFEVELCECKPEYKYDDKGNEIWVRYHDGTTEEWKYDDNGNEIWRKSCDNVYWVKEKPYRKVG